MKGKVLRSHFAPLVSQKEKEARVEKALGSDLPSKDSCIKAKSFTLFFILSFGGIDSLSFLQLLLCGLFIVSIPITLIALLQINLFPFHHAHASLSTPSQSPPFPHSIQLQQRKDPRTVFLLYPSIAHENGSHKEVAWRISSP